MGFKQSAFIRKNTPEIRRKLEEFGRKRSITFDDNQKFIWTTEAHYYSTDNFVIGCSYGESVLPYGINCEHNEQLFLALVALQSDSDKNQWFTDGELWEMSTEDVIPSHYMQMHGHKASVEELIEHFKN